MTLRDFASRSDDRHPDGWTPGYDLKIGVGGVVTSKPFTQQPADWSELLAVWNLDPEVYQVVEPVQMRAWDAHDGRKYYYRAQIVSRQAVEGIPDLSALMADARARRSRPPERAGSDRALAIVLTDWQAGKTEGGGTPALLDRLYSKLDALKAHAKDVKYDEIALFCLGDLVENCFGFYPMQLHATDMDVTTQTGFVRDVLYDFVKEFAPLTSALTIAAVPGNHGEIRINGKAATTFTDNLDLDVVRQVQKVTDENPKAYGHVRYEIATGLSHVVEIAGVTIALSHGHCGRTYSAKRVLDWWQSFAMSRHPLGEADILLTGHYHTLHIDELTGRTWMQAPAMDGGSAWFYAQTGKHSPSGMLAFDILPGTPRRWGHLNVW